MYNDYYLEQINNKLNNTNLYLEEITENQATIIANQQTLISGDNMIINDIRINQHVNFMIVVTLTILLLYTFIKGCFRC